MKYQINALISTVWKMKFWIIIYIFTVIFNVYDICTRNLSPDISSYYFRNTLGIICNFDSYFFLAQVLLQFYFHYLYYNYENRNSPEFVFSRTNFMKTNYKKIIISSIFIILIRTLYFIFLYIPYSEIIKIKISFCILNILIYLFICIFYFILYDFYRKLIFKIFFKKF